MVRWATVQLFAVRARHRRSRVLHLLAEEEAVRDLPSISHRALSRGARVRGRDRLAHRDQPRDRAEAEDVVEVHRRPEALRLEYLS